MGSVTEVLGSQAAGGSVINYTYTDAPWKLFAKDIYCLLCYSWAVPWTLLPLYPWRSGELDELYPSLANLFCVAVHVLLFVLQAAFLLATPLVLLLPGWISLAGIALFSLLNWLFCLSLNGAQITYTSDDQYALKRPEHAHEQWVYINGVSIGKHWMKSNLNRLALTFGRPVLGVHNRTSGILFDLVECLIQRNFCYATMDIRVGYKLVKDILYDPSKSKVVLILHSQGAIEGSMILDWLLQELPQDLLCKLEVYTFGNAANHFNNPRRHAASHLEGPITSKPEVEEVVEQDDDVKEEKEAEYEVEEKEVEEKEVEEKEAEKEHQNHDQQQQQQQPDSLPRLKADNLSSHQDLAIGHIEHYAHNTDFVSMWGILRFATNKMASPQLPRFLGRLFNRNNRNSGHLLVQHYLDGMFPLKRDAASGAFLGADEDNAFMEEVIQIGQEGSTMENAREAYETIFGGPDGFGSGKISKLVEVFDESDGRRLAAGDVRVKDVSRLWHYRNGRSPGRPRVKKLMSTGINGKEHQ